jgi:hypothetical protein
MLFRIAIVLLSLFAFTPSHLLAVRPSDDALGQLPTDGSTLINGPKILGYSPYDHECERVKILPSRSMIYLLVPICSCWKRECDDERFAIYDTTHDVWSRGPEKSDIEYVANGFRLTDEKFLIFVGRRPRMKGVYGVVHRLLGEPRWSGFEWEQGYQLSCVYSIKTNSYGDCKKISQPFSEVSICYNGDRCRLEQLRESPDKKTTMHINVTSGGVRYEQIASEPPVDSERPHIGNPLPVNDGEGSPDPINLSEVNTLEEVGLKQGTDFEKAKRHLSALGFVINGPQKDGLKDHPEISCGSGSQAICSFGISDSRGGGLGVVVESSNTPSGFAVTGVY